LESRIDLDIRIEDSGKERGSSNEDAQGYYTDRWKSTVKKGSRTPQKLCPLDGQKPGIVLMLFNTPRIPAVSVPGRKCPEEFNPNLARFWFGCLLHEMIHAFFSIFTCACWQICDAECLDPVRGWGTFGHGAMFSEVSDAIKESCVREFGLGDSWCSTDDFLGCLDVALDVVWEMSWNGWRPTDSQIRRWRVDPKDVELCITHFQEVKKEEVEKRTRDRSMKMQQALVIYKQDPVGQYSEPKQSWLHWLREIWNFDGVGIILASFMVIMICEIIGIMGGIWILDWMYGGKL